MLAEQDFVAWAMRIGLSDRTLGVIARIRSSEPSRRVGGGRANVTGRYPSKKMGVTIQFESHRVELPTVFELEHDKTVLEYYDQVAPIKLDYYSAEGRRLAVAHTPDFFVIRDDRAGWEECKTEEELKRLSERNPHRYRREEDRWTCPPGHQYAQLIGLYYRLRSSAEINWLFQRNIHFLEDYLRSEPQVSSLRKQRALAYVAAQPGCSLTDLFHSTDGQLTRDDIYTLIATGDIYVDLLSAVLPEPERVTVWLEKPRNAPSSDSSLSLRTGTTLDWDGRTWTVLNPGLSAVVLRGDDGTITDVPSDIFTEAVQQSRIRIVGNRPVVVTAEMQQELLVAGEAELEQATRRFRIVSKALRKERHEFVPDRTLRRWIAAYRAGIEQHGNGFMGLLPKPNHGNPGSKLSERAGLLMQEFIVSNYESLKQKTIFAAWSALKLACDREVIPAPSFKTFSVAVHQRPGAEQTQKRQGSRAAYQVQPFFWELEQRTPRHGDRPFEIGHMDHTQADVWVVCSQTGRLLGRPWLSLLVDAFSRRMLALYLTFDPPSYRSAMMILRECVRRHGRLPQTLVLDGGKEFESVYFETLLARCEVTKKTRPPAKARVGSTCERLFGTTNKQFLHNLAGNTRAARNTRQITKSVDPRNHAAWTFQVLYQMLTEYTYEVYDTLDHPALGQSPREAFTSAFAETGNRAHRNITYDRDFLIFTLPTTRKGTAKITAGRGMKLNNLYYWSEHFRNPTWQTQQVPVRYDPFDVGTAFAFLDRQWIECHSEYYVSLHGHSEREVHLVSEELRKQRRNHSGQFAVTAKTLAEFLESVEVQEEILVQRLSDLEARSYHAQSDSPALSIAVGTLMPHPSTTLAYAPISVEPAATFVTYGEL
ncbi:MAG: Mu transposase C-terminal domain-containing protein [Bryobacteraceae bacterium]